MWLWLWFYLVTVVLALGKWLQIFSPLMGCGSLFGGFVSLFVGFVGFCIWVCFILFYFFAEITVVKGYWWIWLWVHNREKRKIEVLGFREFGYGFTISISPRPYQTPSFSKFFSKSSLYVGKLLLFFLFFSFFFLRFNTYPLFNFLSLFGFQENKMEKNIGYCSLCCLSFILLCKS